MRYQIRVAGKIFEGSDLKALLRRAVEAKRAKERPAAAPEAGFATVHRRLSLVQNA